MVTQTLKYLGVQHPLSALKHHVNTIFYMWVVTRCPLTQGVLIERQVAFSSNASSHRFCKEDLC